MQVFTCTPMYLLICISICSLCRSFSHFLTLAKHNRVRSHTICLRLASICILLLANGEIQSPFFSNLLFSLPSAFIYLFIYLVDSNP